MQFSNNTSNLLVVSVTALMAAAILYWQWPAESGMTLRIPGTDHSPDPLAGASLPNPVLAGKTTKGPSTPSDLPGAWPQFRGAHRDGTASESTSLPIQWGGGALTPKWVIEVGEGYAGPVIDQGCVYLMDYDRETQSDTLRCLSLEDGREIWDFAYPLSVKRNHGMSRTVPVVSDGYVVAMGPKCHVLCVEAETGALLWTRDLVSEFGATVPPWYNGQCPWVKDGQVVLGVGGEQGLLMALNLSDGALLWQSSNLEQWKMTHSSIMEVEVAGKPQLVYCASGGVAGVDPSTGKVLWSTSEWKISIATVPSPVDLGGGRIFLCGGYNAGSMILKIDLGSGAANTFEVEVEKRLEPSVFGSTQQTPVLHDGHVYGVREDGKLVCLDLEGRIVWVGDEGHSFGLGPYIIANDMILALSDKAVLTLAKAGGDGYEMIGEARLLENARESWGPMAMAGSRLVLRDINHLLCVDFSH